MNKPVGREERQASNGSSSQEQYLPSFIVGVGASAGGLDAIQKLFDGVRPDTGLAFVIVQHLSPDFRSMMDELLSRHTQMAIHRVEDGMLVEPNSIYLIPPKKEMIISEGKLLLTDKDPDEGLSLPINTFLQSLARDVGRRAIAIILSGSGSDGARGVKAVHDAGGLVIAQTEDSAGFESMPKSAVDTGMVDLCLPPGELGAAIDKYVANPQSPPVGEAPVDGEELGDLFKLLKAEYGIDFSWYKTSTVGRRIERRLVMLKKANLAAYLETLRTDRSELNNLYKDLLIGVTQFFRDPPAFDLLAEDVIPQVLENAQDGSGARFWVAGCATGEEAYSLGILVLEQIEKTSLKVDVKIFATDVHQASLDHASNGLYEAQSLAALSKERLEKYFKKRGSSYQVCSELRKLIVFAPHNLIRDAPFTRIDVITCRNMLIYLEPKAQQKVISLFHFALRPQGVLLLGPSETPGELSDEFDRLDNHWKLYRKRRDVRLSKDLRLPPVSSYTDLRAVAGLRPYIKRTPEEEYLLPACESLVRDYGPPSLLVGGQHELLHTFAGGSEFLRRGDGAASTNLLDMVGGSFRTTLAGALQRAERHKTDITFTGVDLQRGGERIRASVIVKPIQDQQGAERFLISIVEPSAPLPQNAEGNVIEADEATNERMLLLEQELAHTKENLQATIEELETSNEELQATNEELVASNEELQSTNEELHSVNEELHTVNAEHQQKIGQLTALTEDIENLLRASDAGSVFLDDQLRVRRSSKRAEQIFHIVETDLGRPLEAFNHKLDYPELLADARAVLADQRPREKEACDSDGVPYLVRINPYESRVGSDGVVITMTDITTLHTANAKMVESERRFRGTFDNAAVGIAHVNLDGSWMAVNQRLCEIVDYTRDELLASTFQDITHRDDLNSDLRQLDQLIKGEIDRYSMEKRYIGRGGREVWINLTVSLQSDDAGAPLYCISIVEDITQRKQFEHDIQQSVEQRDHFMATLSHELRNPLAALLHAARLMDRLRDGGQGDNPLDVVLRQAGQMSHLLDDLLDTSRMTQNKIVLSREPCLIREIARDAAEAIQPQIEAKGHRFSMHFPEERYWIDADRARMLQVVENLLTNAVKYTPSGGEISLTVTPHEDQVLMEVTDNGYGLSQRMLSRVFEMFVQSSKNLHDREGGMGLGLTLVRSLVEMHGGTVRAASDGVGKGSTFSVQLPTTTRRPDEQKPTNKTTSGVVPPPHRLKRRRVVLVEDERDAREMLTESMQLDGYEVTAAEDGDEGLAAILRERPDVALVDIALPGLSGFEIAKRVRKTLDTDATYLVALTGYGRESDRETALAAGFDEHLVKPVGPDALERVLTKPASQQPV